MADSPQKRLSNGGMLPLHLGERLNGIQEVSGSIPLYLHQHRKALKTLRFQGFLLEAEQALLNPQFNWGKIKKTLVYEGENLLC